MKRYILEKDIKYLSHWDIVSVFIENMGNKKEVKPLAMVSKPSNLSMENDENKQE